MNYYLSYSRQCDFLKQLLKVDLILFSAFTVIMLSGIKSTRAEFPSNIVLSVKNTYYTDSKSLSTKKVIKDIRGTVVDSSGVLPGVTVTIKGTTKSVTTDLNGKFIIEVPDENTILVFSMVGYKTQEISVRGKELMNVTLVISNNVMDEVVIEGFGKRKRSDMVGSVTSITPENLRVPSSNLTTALAGRAAGVIAYQRSGEPGADNADFFIRGVTTFGYKTSPLILIDGIELTTTDLARLQPNDIASFSILKDATSTAIYGARGANGIILVTTKQGKIGKAKLNFVAESSLSSPTKDIELADPVTYMRMYNESVLTRIPIGSIQNNPLYSEEKIANTAAGMNPLVYPANNWKQIMFRDNTLNQRYNLNVSGGGGVARYFVSASYNKDNGIMKVDKRNSFNNNIDLKSYTLRSNVDIDLTKSTFMTVRLSGNFDDYTGPIDGGAAMYLKVMRSNPVLFPAFFPIDNDHQHVRHIMFGNAVGENGYYINPYADMTKGYKDYSRSLMQAQVELKQDLSAFTNGLTFRTMLNTNRTSFFDVQRFYNPYYYQLAGYDVLSGSYKINNILDNNSTEYLGYNEGQKEVSSSFYLESMLDYRRDFNKHGLAGLLVFRMREALNANAGDLQRSLPARNLGLSGRATYSYDNRYYGEFTFGYNGSERFAEKDRYGFFPSVGVAWSISNEKFMEPYKSIISNLRLRATYGLIGNDEIGRPEDRFFYLSNVNMNSDARGAVFGPGNSSDVYRSGVLISRYSNPDITWETSEKKNLALELGLFNKMNIRAEYFTEMRKNILMNRASIPSSIGFSAPIFANIGRASGRGVDISMDYSHSFSNGLFLSALGNFTLAKSKYEVYEEPAYAEAYRLHTGRSIHQNYGYIAERLFVDDEEAANSPKQSFGGVYGGGDIKYTDVNRDGEITPADQVPLGNPTLPEITYGFGLSASFKRFDINGFFQGLANESFWIDNTATAPFISYRYNGEPSAGGTLQNQVLKAYAESYWSEDNQDVKALWPRLSSTHNPNNSQLSTWFMRDGSFLRLKSVEIGYTLPKRFLEKIHTSNFRLYVSGTNLLTFSKFKMWDVEMGGNGLGYPTQKVFNLGVNVTFR